MLLLFHGRLVRSGNQRLVRRHIDFFLFFRLILPQRSTVWLSAAIPAARGITISQNVQSTDSEDTTVELTGIE
jgi:hypothetical protein